MYTTMHKSPFQKTLELEMARLNALITTEPPTARFNSDRGHNKIKKHFSFLKMLQSLLR